MTTDTEAFRPASGGTATPRTLILVALVAFVVGLAVMAAGYAMYLEHWAGTGQAAPADIPAAPQASEPGAPSRARADALAAREQALAGRIGELESRLASVDNSSRAASGFATRAEGLMVAFAARRALDRGLALGYIEGQLRERFGSVEPHAVATVIGAARQPTTLQDLRLALDTLGPDLLTAGRDAGLWSKVRRGFGDLIVLRHESTPSPRPHARLERAQRMLDAGQIEGALAEVARLPGAGKAQAWMTAAKRYIGARQALDGIEAAAIRGRGLRSRPDAAAVSEDSKPAASASPPAAPAT